MKTGSLVVLLALAISAQACASETDAPTDEQDSVENTTPVKVTVEPAKLAPSEAKAPRDSVSGNATGRRAYLPVE